MEFKIYLALRRPLRQAALTRRRGSNGGRLLYDLDLIFREPAKLADETVDLLIGGFNLARKEGILVARPIVSASRLPEASI